MAERKRLPGTVAEIAASPQDPKIGAFFDLDGTLIHGMSARHLSDDKEEGQGYDLKQVLQTLGVVVSEGGLTPPAFEHLLSLAGANWRGRTVEDLHQMGERLFHKKLANLIYPEMRALVRAHQARGHTVVLISSATEYQVQAVANFLGFEHVVCNRFEDEDGVLTGDLVRPVVWGPGKATAAQTFAAEHGVDLDASYFYADGDEDTALMYLVGHPRPTNPGRRLNKVAHKRGWPVLEFTSRGHNSTLRGVLGFAALLPMGAIGAVKGVLNQDKRVAINYISENWPSALFAINGVRVLVEGQEHAENHRPAIFIFNHRNNFDGFVAASIVKRDFTGVAKSELAEDPILGTAGRLGDVVFVDRADSVKAVAALKPLEEAIAKGLSVMLAPEGTRVDTTTVGAFKKGAFRMAMATGVPIIPIVISNAEMIGARNATSINPGVVRARVLPPISVDDWTVAELSDRIAEVRQQFIDALADMEG